MYETRILREEVEELRAQIKVRTKRRSVKNRCFGNATLLTASDVDLTLLEGSEGEDENTVVVT